MGAHREVPHHELHRTADDLSHAHGCGRCREAPRPLQLRHGVSAGEPLPADTLEALKKRFGITLIDGIGMSECMVYCYNMIDAPLKPGSCGRPGPGTVIELLDSNLAPVGPGEDGRLVRPPRLSSGHDEGILAQARAHRRGLPRRLVLHRRRARSR